MSIIKVLSSSFLILCSIGITVSCQFKSENVDLIVHNAIIYSVNPEFEKFQAMAIKEGKIIALGAEREILNRYDAKDIVDAASQYIYPGFIDAHCHFLSYGFSLNQINLAGTHSWQECLDKLKDYGERNESKWIQGRGWDQNDWEVKEFPTRKLLDSLFPDRPVFIRRIDGHAGIANQVALRAANINAETTIEGGKIFKDQNGELTGLLLDEAMELIDSVIPEPDYKEILLALLAAQSNCLKAGLTTVDDAGLDLDEIKAINELYRNGQLKMKIYAMLNPSDENKEIITKGFDSDERLHINSVKLYGDGALGSRGAYLKHPYSDDPGNRGFMLHPPEYYRDWAQLCFDNNYQLNTHCIGDQANLEILNIYAELLKSTNDRRWRIEHAQIVDPLDFSKFKAFNIIPSVQPTHATSDMYWVEGRLGDSRMKEAYSYQSLLNQNGIIALGTDFPVEDISPVKTFVAAVFRTDENEFPENGFRIEEGLDRKQALMGMTIWAAIANFEENEKGSLEIGKSADFVLLNTDLMEAPENLIRSTKVKATYINGEKVF